MTKLAIGKKSVLGLYFIIITLVSSLIYNFAGASIWSNEASCNYGVRTGYFDCVKNSTNYGNGYVLPNGFPVTTDISTMVNYLYGEYHSGDERRQTGSSYIVNSMLGRSQPRGNVWLNEDTDWADLTSRMESSVISIDNYYYATYDTGMNRRIDVFRVPNNYGAGRYVVFRNRNTGVVEYAIHTQCANPDGSLPAGLSVIPKGYSLIPGFSAAPSNITESGSQISLTPIVDNSGPANSGSTSWTLSKTVTESPGKNGTTTAESGSTIFTASPSRTYLASYSETANYDAGARVCFILSATPHSNTDAGTVSSTPACTVVGKKPKIQILGGDLLVGGLISTSTSVKSTTTFGSWAEYGVFATSTIKGLASGAAFSGGLVGATTCTSGVLSFTNAGSSTCVANTTVIGNYTNTNSSTDIAASFPGGSAVPAGIPSSWPSGIYNAGDLTLNASNLGSGKTIVIKSTGTVTIAGNQTYTNGPYASISDLPQLVIIANKIVINSGVTNVDAWLVAKNSAKTGIIQTCESVGNSINTCNTKLTVNGPVMTDHLYLYRTAGSGTGAASGDPAEVFNLRADAYLWAQAQAVNRSRVQTVYTTELPPRL